MGLTQINNHVAQALARLMQQVQSIPTQYTITFPISGITIPVSGLTGLLAGIVDQIQGIENAAFGVYTGQQLFDGSTTPAVGVQLDGIGKIVGLPRNGLTDTQYILFIFGTIAANFSRGTYLDLFNCASYLFGSTAIYIQDLPISQVGIEVAGSMLPVSLNPQAKALLQRVPSGGVGVAFVAQTSDPNAFRLSCSLYPTPNVTGANNGLSSLASPSIGGKLVGVI